MSQHLFTASYPFRLESGRELPNLVLAYNTFGTLNADKSNVIWVFHALTANANVPEWWSGLFGSDRILDPEKYFIICVNMPGSCYGSIGPLDTDPVNGAPYYHNFPQLTIRDMVLAYRLLKDELGIKRIYLGIGGSMGGQQLLEWAVEEPAIFEHIVPFATNARHSAWGIAFNATQRMCIEADSTWKDNDPAAGMEGMKIARAVALLSYRNYRTYQEYQTEENNEKVSNFKSESYQRYQGEKLSRRFNAFSYYFLSRSMDTHNLGRNRHTVIEALQRITAKTLVLSLTTDLLFPQSEQEFLAAHIQNACFHLIDSSYGHDGFLLENEQINDSIKRFLRMGHVNQIEKTLLN